MSSPPDDFVAFILTNRRPETVITYKNLRKHGYTGPIRLLVDTDDPTLSEYEAIYGDEVVRFDKSEIAEHFDEGDNFNDRRCIVYARNACFPIAEQLGYTYFMQLDDDYTTFRWRPVGRGPTGSTSTPIENLDRLFTNLLTLYKNTPMLTMAIGQGGDYIGGATKNANPYIIQGWKRKAMNSFICSTDRPFLFPGRINEDVNMYTSLGRRGELIYTLFGAMLDQMTTQTNKGGMTEQYLDNGTYVKSFYTILHTPSSVKISTMGGSNRRIHHKVMWNKTAPMLIHEQHKQAGGQ